MEKDRVFLSKYAIDLEINNSFDSDEDLEYDFEKSIKPEPDTIEMDEMDWDMWGDY